MLFLSEGFWTATVHVRRDGESEVLKDEMPTPAAVMLSYLQVRSPLSFEGQIVELHGAIVAETLDDRKAREVREITWEIAGLRGML